MVGGRVYEMWLGGGDCEAPKGPLQLLWWAGAKRLSRKVPPALCPPPLTIMIPS